MAAIKESGGHGAIFPVAASWLAPTALTRWVEDAYGLPSGDECRLISESINQTYRVRREDATRYLRIGRTGWRTRAEVEAEIAAIAALDRADIAVATVVPQRDGNVVGEIAAPEGSRLAVLFEEAPGGSAREIEPDQCRAYGRLAARVHGAWDADRIKIDRVQLGVEHLIDEPLAAIRARMGEHAAEMAFLDDAADRVRRRILTFPNDDADIGLCHGDLHPGNVRFAANGEATLFDFDCCGYGWRGYDLAVFLWNAYTERRPRRWRASRWNAFLRGYREVRRIEPAALEMVPLFLVARQIWLGGLDCADASGWLPQWIYEGWFKTLNGVIRGWVEEYPILR